MNDNSIIRGFPFWVKVRMAPHMIKEWSKRKYQKLANYVYNTYYGIYEKIWNKYDWKISPKLLKFKKNKYLDSLLSSYSGSKPSGIRVILSNAWNHEMYELCESSHDLRESKFNKIYNATLYTAMILNKMEILECVGLQPLTANVGEVFDLVYTEKNINKPLDNPLDNHIELEMRIVSNPIEVKAFPLNTRASYEVIVDFTAIYHTNSEFYKIITNELAWELESKLFHEIVEHSGNMDVTDVDVTRLGEDINPLAYRIKQASFNVGQETRRGTANVAFVSWEVCNKLLGKVSGSDGIHYEGVIGGNIQVYSVPSTMGVKEDFVMIGYCGHTEVDNGVTYVPYQLIKTHGVTMDPVTFEPFLAFYSRSETTYKDNVDSYYKLLKI